jgi:NhaP-type Na+/H+ or K+/H+ antiporter
MNGAELPQARLTQNRSGRHQAQRRMGNVTNTSSQMAPQHSTNGTALDDTSGMLQIGDEMSEIDLIAQIQQDELNISALSHTAQEGTEFFMLFFLVMLLIGCIARLGLEYINNALGIKIPSSVMLLTIGMLIGFLTWEGIVTSEGEPKEMLTLSLVMWTWMDPRVILFLFLPALIFESSMSTDYYIFRQQLVSGMMLAGPGMLIQILLIALWAMYCFPYDWGLTESLLFGSILSATDPVAVIALMKEMSLLSDLRVLFEAESLMNDGTAIVVFELCIMTLVAPESGLHYFTAGLQVTSRSWQMLMFLLVF